MSENKKVLKAEVDGQEIELWVVKPTQKVQQQAQLVYGSAFRQAVKPEDGRPGAIVRAALEGVLREQKLWDDAKQKEFERLSAALLKGEKALAEGGKKLSEGRAIALQMRRDRYAYRQLNSDRNALDLNTAEAQAENARFAYLVAACTRTREDKPYYKSMEDYLGRENDPVGFRAATLLGQLIYGLDEDAEKKLPENKFLLKWKFCREGDLHLIDAQGRLIDAQGRLVDEKGRLINEEGKLVDTDGNLLTEEGDYLVEEQPWLDEDGSPLLENNPSPQEAKTVTAA
jgi:hypothetical protein